MRDQPTVAPPVPGVGHVCAVVVGGGGPVDPAVVAALGGVPAGAAVYAADSGADLALALGLDVGVVVGDLDSISDEALRLAEAAGARIDRYPVAKDATDLAIAVATAVADGAAEVLVLAGAGGRLDHLLAGALALADRCWSAVAIRAVLGGTRIHVLHGPGRLAITGRRTELLSLVPVGGRAVGVTTGGLRYPLVDATLDAGTTRGVSNVVDDPAGTATVTLGDGTLLVVLPGELDIDSPVPPTDPGAHP